MKQAVVIGTWYGNREPLGVLLESLRGCGYPVWIVVGNAKHAPPDPEWLESIASHWNLIVRDEAGFELGAFRAILDETDIDEFLFLQDTFEVLDQAFIDDVFDRDDSVALGPTFFHYAGTWKRAVLEQMEIPVVRTKQESIHWEHTFSRLYWQRTPVHVYDPHFHDGENQGFVDRYGRLNMLLQNDKYRKYKGTWG